MKKRIDFQGVATAGEFNKLRDKAAAAVIKAERQSHKVVIDDRIVAEHLHICRNKHEFWQLLDRLDMSGSDFRVILYLLKTAYSKNGKCNPRVRTIADATGLPPGTVRNSILNLRNKHRILYSKMHKGSAWYYFAFPKEAAVTEISAISEETELPKSRQPSYRDFGRQDTEISATSYEQWYLNNGPEQWDHPGSAGGRNRPSDSRCYRNEPTASSSSSVMAANSVDRVNPYRLASRGGADFDLPTATPEQRAAWGSNWPEDSYLSRSGTDAPEQYVRRQVIEDSLHLLGYRWNVEDLDDVKMPDDSGFRFRDAWLDSRIPPEWMSQLMRRKREGVLTRRTLANALASLDILPKPQNEPRAIREA